MSSRKRRNVESLILLLDPLLIMTTPLGTQRDARSPLAPVRAKRISGRLPQKHQVSAAPTASSDNSLGATRFPPTNRKMLRVNIHDSATLLHLDTLHPG